MTTQKYLTTPTTNLRTREEYLQEVGEDEYLVDFFSNAPEWNFPSDSQETAVDLAKQRLVEESEDELAVVKVVAVVRAPKKTDEELEAEKEEFRSKIEVESAEEA